VYKLLIDTCVWLDIAKDQRLQPTLSVLERLVESNTVHLIVPQIVVDEFQRNKARVAEDCRKSLSSVFKRVKAAVKEFGDPDERDSVLSELDNVDHQIPLLGESAIGSIARIEKLIDAATVLETTQATKLLAAERAISALAPFHRNRNGIGDAIILETFASCAATKDDTDELALITHNIHDFSDPVADKRLPHPDIASVFDGKTTFYYITLHEALGRVDTDLLAEIIDEEEWTQEPRKLSEILYSMEEMLDKIWYGRHGLLAHAVATGKTQVVDAENYPSGKYDPRLVRKDIWEGARNAAIRVEQKYGAENLGPWSDFEWGMINGKLSALRWMLGDEWDMLDT